MSCAVKDSEKRWDSQSAIEIRLGYSKRQEGTAAPEEARIKCCNCSQGLGVGGLVFSETVKGRGPRKDSHMMTSKPSFRVRVTFGYEQIRIWGLKTG